MKCLLKIPLSPYSVEDRFWSHVQRGESNECWLWTGALRRGYGTFKVSRGEFGCGGRRDLYAHRVVYHLTHGRWPQPLARHTCDRPPCCNPAHIIEGTWRDNMADKYARGRAVHPTGAGSPNTRLTQEQVTDLRARFVAGECSQRQLASEFGVAQATISRIVNGRRWPR